MSLRCVKGVACHIWIVGCKVVVVSAVALAVTGCSSYSKFIAELNNRKVNSCVEGNVYLGYLTGTAMLKVYTGTGGADVMECINRFRETK
jgi:hypothetical protein